MGRGRLAGAFFVAAMLATAALAVAKADKPVTDSAAVPSNQSKAANARCTHASRVALAGFKSTVNQTQGTIVKSLEPGKRAVKASAYSYPANGKVTALAFCSKHAPYHIVRGLPIEASLGAGAEAAAECPDDERVQLAGFKITPAEPFVLPEYLELESPSKVVVSIFNPNSSVPASVRAIAACADRPLPPPVEKTVTPSLSDSRTVQAKAKCPVGKNLVMAGFEVTSPGESGPFLSGLVPNRKRATVTVKALMSPGNEQPLTALAYCR